MVLLTTKYHLGSIIAIFFAIGIGILIGGTLGQKWMDQTENHIVEILMDKYEQQLSRNERLQEQIIALQWINQAVSPMFEHKKVLWIGPSSKESEMLAIAMGSIGAEWTERNMDRLPAMNSKQSDLDEHSSTDILVFSQSNMSEQQIANLVLYLNNIIEGESHVPISHDHYPSLE